MIGPEKISLRRADLCFEACGTEKNLVKRALFRVVEVTLSLSDPSNKIFFDEEFSCLTICSNYDSRGKNSKRMFCICSQFIFTISKKGILSQSQQQLTATKFSAITVHLPSIIIFKEYKTMVFRNVLSLSLILAFMWSDKALSFSSPTCLTTPSSSRYSTSTMTTQSLRSSSENYGIAHVMPSLRPQLQSTQLAMSAEDSSGEKEVTTEQEDGSESASTQNKNGIMMVPLFCKFVAVLMIKFLKDLVVFPTLFVWRFANKLKQKIFGWFDKVSFGTTASTFKPNGTSK